MQKLSVIHPKLDKLKNLVKNVLTSDDSDFYRSFYKENGIKIETFGIDNSEDIETLPFISSSNLSDVPLKKRIYKYGYKFGKLCKINSENQKPYLIERKLCDIKQENYGKICKRPQILLRNNHEALEKSLWFYENDMLPLIGEPNNLQVALYCAKKYNIDALLSEEEFLDNYVKLLIADPGFSHLNLTMLGDFFDSKKIFKNLMSGSVRYVLELPETGAFAESCPEALKRGELIFHSDKNSILEAKGRLIVTKLIEMPTPIIRYQTDIFVEPVEKRCSCEEEMCFSLI
jgi:hypothetical protein